MALVVNTDTYITLAEANTYISEHYTSTDPLKVAWEALSNIDKEVYLRNAAISIDALALKGKKYEYTQKMQFPRCYDSFSYKECFQQYSDPDEYVQYGRLYCELIVPNNIKYAQAEIAIFNCDKKANKRANLQNQGVQSFSIGDLSENYGSKRSPYSNESIIKSKKAIELLRPYLGGTYNVV